MYASASSVLEKPTHGRLSFLCCTDKRVSPSLGGVATCPRSCGQQQWDRKLRPGCSFPESALCTASGSQQIRGKPEPEPEGQAVWRVSDVVMVGRLHLQTLGAYHLPSRGTIPAHPCTTSAHHMRVPSPYTSEHARVPFRYAPPRCPIPGVPARVSAYHPHVPTSLPCGPSDAPSQCTDVPSGDTPVHT